MRNCAGPVITVVAFSMVTMLTLTLTIAKAQVTLSDDPFPITLYVDDGSLTIVVEGNEVVSLVGLVLEVNRVRYRIWDYVEYQSLYLDAVQAPACFRWYIDDDVVPPDPCDTRGVRLAPGTAFWINPNTGRRNTILIMRDTTELARCDAGQTRCVLIYTPPTFTPFPSASSSEVPATDTPTLVLVKEYSDEDPICTARIEEVPNGIEGVPIRVGPGEERSIRDYFPVEEDVPVVGKYIDEEGLVWWNIHPEGYDVLEPDRYWVRARYVDISEGCEQPVPTVTMTPEIIRRRPTATPSPEPASPPFPPTYTSVPSLPGQPTNTPVPLPPTNTPEPTFPPVQYMLDIGCSGTTARFRIVYGGPYEISVPWEILRDGFLFDSGTATITQTTEVRSVSDADQRAYRFKAPALWLEPGNYMSVNENCQ